MITTFHGRALICLLMDEVGQWVFLLILGPDTNGVPKVFGTFASPPYLPLVRGDKGG